ESEYESAYEQEKSQDKVLTEQEEEKSDDAAANSQADKSENLSADKEESMPFDKNVTAGDNVVNVDELDSMD
ncbi:hypothetical protein A2U01_0107830, partial [Trifolium medium]|nr:hypothetical protein [Trifolium medium]